MTLTQLVYTSSWGIPNEAPLPSLAVGGRPLSDSRRMARRDHLVNPLLTVVRDVAKLVNALAGVVAELAIEAKRPDLWQKVYDALEPGADQK